MLQMAAAPRVTDKRTHSSAKELLDVLELLADHGHCEWPTSWRLNLTARMLEEMHDHNRARVFRRAAVLLKRREEVNQ